MYGAIFRLIPGPKWFKAIVMVALLAAAVYALFTWVFPWVNDTFFESTVE